MHSFLLVPQELCNIWGEGRGMETPPPAPLQYINPHNNLTASPSHMHVKPSHYANTFCLETNKNFCMSICIHTLWSHILLHGPGAQKLNEILNIALIKFAQKNNNGCLTNIACTASQSERFHSQLKQCLWGRSRNMRTVYIFSDRCVYAVVGFI